MSEGYTGKAGLRCRPGDLAIVTKCGVPERIGLLVRVIERCAESDYDWLVELQGPGIVARGLKTRRIGRRKNAFVCDWNLTPINGLDLPSQMALTDHSPLVQKV